MHSSNTNPLNFINFEICIDWILLLVKPHRYSMIIQVGIIVHDHPCLSKASMEIQTFFFVYASITQHLRLEFQLWWKSSNSSRNFAVMLLSFTDANLACSLFSNRLSSYQRTNGRQNNILQKSKKDPGGHIGKSGQTNIPMALLAREKSKTK